MSEEQAVLILEAEIAKKIQSGEIFSIYDYVKKYVDQNPYEKESDDPFYEYHHVNESYRGVITKRDSEGKPFYNKYKEQILLNYREYFRVDGSPEKVPELLSEYICFFGTDLSPEEYIELVRKYKFSAVEVAGLLNHHDMFAVHVAIDNTNEFLVLIKKIIYLVDYIGTQNKQLIKPVWFRYDDLLNEEVVIKFLPLVKEFYRTAFKYGISLKDIVFPEDYEEQFLLLKKHGIIGS
jgi:hypothetical protein